MNAVEIQQAGMQSTVGRDCRERLPSRACDPLHAWTSSRRLSVGSALMDFPTFSWASRSS